jgi:DNA-binding IclR family transcriptional regulator
MFAEKTQSVPALERGLAILESLSKSKHGLTLTQLTTQLELPKSSVHCLLLTFERHGYLYRDERWGRYRLGCGYATWQAPR